MRLQAVPHCVPLLAVDKVGLGLLDVKVHGIRGAIGHVKVLPRVLVAGLGLILFSGHPDGKACIVQPEAVEGPGEAQLLDGGAQIPEEGVKVHCREPQRHYSQHYRQQRSPLPHSHLRQADAGGPKQDGGEQQGPLPALLVVEQVEGTEFLERFGVHGDRGRNGLRHRQASPFLVIVPYSFSAGKGNLAQMAQNVVE